MAKRTINPEPKHPLAKKMGRSARKFIIDPVLGDKVTIKVFNARKVNNPERYQQN